MIYLLLAILCSSLINLIFKAFSHYQIHLLTAIVVNYLTCSILGQAIAGSLVWSKAQVDAPYFEFALALGLLFIIIFFCMGTTTQKFGVGVNAVSAKMGFVFPSLFFLIYLQEPISSLQVLAIGIAIIAILLMVPIKQSPLQPKNNLIIYPILVFLGSGLIDAALKWMELKLGADEQALMASTTIFSSAAVVGLVILLIKSPKIELKNILAGILLGIPNLFSIYFLILAIGHLKQWSTGLFFASNNLGVIVLSTLAAVFLMSEKLNSRQRVGLFLSCLSIIIVSIAI